MLLGLNLILRKKGGYQTVAASDAITAMMVARKESPDLIILDVGLPGGNGIQLMRNMKTLVSLACTPMIVVTAREAALEREAIAAGAEAFFQKPADTDALLAAIRAALGE